MSTDIVFSFDTTGSMYPCLGQVRSNVERTVTNLLKEVPDLRIGIVAHGDYCDERSTYLMKSVGLGSTLQEITRFVRTVGRTGGGDAPEAYEYVLNKVNDFDWRNDAQKILVMIGDATPHEPDYHMNHFRLDWRKESDKLGAKGINIYSIQCLGRRSSDSFYSSIADRTNGLHLELDQFSEIETLIQAIGYRQVSVDAVKEFEQVIYRNGIMTRSLDKSFGVLTGRPRDEKGRFVSTKAIDKETGKELVPVPLGRFQLLHVRDDVVIKDFVEENDLLFQPGRGFYEFTKRELIQDKKEIVIRDRKTGDMFSGASARSLMGIPVGLGKRKISPGYGDQYDVFVQSTSYNRKLIAGQRFLYEVDMDR